jgi:uncharacterized protein
LTREQVLVGFGRLLRRRGLPVGTGRIMSFCRASALLAPLDRDHLYWAGKSTLVSRPEHFEAFDRAFDDYFGASRMDETLAKLFEFADKSEPPMLEGDGPGYSEWTLAEEEEEIEGEAEVQIIAGRNEILREKSFEELSEEERRDATRMIRRLALDLPLRRSRRLRPAPKGGLFDLRRTLRYSLRTHGEPFRRAWVDRRTRSRPLLLILDVSGSMSPYARALMQFGFAAMTAGQRVEVFCFGTRLTRVTRTLRAKDPDRALEEVGRVVKDWAGGTRIGDSIKELLDRYGATASLRGAVTIICSDGLERGDPELLRVQMERLARLSHRIVWVNPLKGDPRYQPLARGMNAVLPYIDVFLPGHNLASLEVLAQAVGRV